MADVSIDIELVTKAFNAALKESSGKVKGFQIQVERGEKGVSTSFRKIDSGAKKTSKSFGVLGGAVSSFVGNLAANAVASFAQSLINVGRGALEGSIRFEQLQTRFEVLTGSIAETDRLLRDLTEFSASTPFQLEQIANAGAQLLAFGTASENVIGQLQRIGDVSAASGQSIERLSFIFGQIQNQGRLTAERLNQLQEAGVPIGPALARTLGIAETQLRDFVSNTGVSFTQFEQAFNSLSDAGGPAFQGLIKQSQTLGGLISTLKDNFSVLQVTVGQELLPFLKEIASTFLELIQNNREFITNLGIQAIRGLINVVTLGIQAFDLFLASLTAVQNVIDLALFSAEKLRGGLLFLAEAAVNAAIAIRSLATDDPSPTLERAAQSLRDLKAASDITAAGVAENIDKRIQAREKEKRSLDEFVEKLRAAGQSEVDIEAARAQEKERRQQEAARKDAEAERARQQAIKEVRDQFEQDREIIEIEAQIAQQEENIAGIERVRELENEKIRIIQEAELKKAETIQDSNEKLKAQEQAKAKADLARLKVGLETKKRTADAQKKIDDDLRKNEERSFEGRIQASRNFLQAGLTLAKQGSKEQKALSIADATVNTYAAATRAYKDYPFPANIAVMASTIAIGLAQVAKIQSAGNFANGGLVGGSSFTGDNLSANVNSGELILNRAQQQRLFNIANGTETPNQQISGPSAEQLEGAISRAMSNMQIVLVADDTEIARSASRGVDNGIVIGSN